MGKRVRDNYLDGVRRAGEWMLLAIAFAAVLAAVVLLGSAGRRRTPC